MQRHLRIARAATVPYRLAADLLRTSAQALLGTGEADGPTLHVEVAGFSVARPVRVVAGHVVEVDDNCVRVPVRWEPAGRHGVLPVLEGTLEVVGLAEHPPTTRVSFTGRYRPPLGRLGAVADGLAGHALARRTVRRMVEDVADRLLAATPGD